MISDKTTPLIICGSTPAAHELHRNFSSDLQCPSSLCADWSEAYSLADSASPCILIATEDLLTPGALAELRVRKIQNQGLHVIVLTQGTAQPMLREWLRCGCEGFLECNCDAITARKAFDCVLAGEIWAGRKVVSAAMRLLSSVIHDTLLTRREREILERVADGLDNRSIAEDLFITRETVRWHLRSAYSKLGVHDRQALSSLAGRAAAGSE